MSQTRRVFVTGVGAVTATGMNAETTWKALLAGQQGLGNLKLWDLATWSHQKVGELQEFQPATMLPDRKLLKLISRQDVTGISAGMQAMTDSQILAYRDQLNAEQQTVFSDEFALYVGSPGNKYFQQYDFLPLIKRSQTDMKIFAEHLFSDVHPMWLLRILPNNVLAYLGITYGIKGTNHNFTNHAVSGTQALLEAQAAIVSGKAQRALVVGYDIGTDPQGLFYYDKLGLLSDQDLKPFDAQHNGTILAEGASALILESEEAVQQRSARCYAELIGGSCTTEARGLFTLDPEAEALQTLLSQTLERYQIHPQELAMIIAHGNGSHLSDVTEARALSALVGKESTPVTAFKWSMGHTLCASGILDTVLGLHAMQNRCIPGIANLNTVAQDCTSLNLSRETREWQANKDHMLVINRGFAGMNACVVLRACP